MSDGNSLPSYEHTQPAHLIRILLVLVSAVTLATMLSLPAPEGEAWVMNVVLASVLVTFLVCLGLFWSLTVTVTESALRWQFGVGLIGKVVPLHEIDSCQPTRTSFWHGWGIHWSPRGWVYNVSGFGAVEVRLKSGKAFLLGSDEPDLLAKALKEAMGSR